MTYSLNFSHWGWYWPRTSCWGLLILLLFLLSDSVILGATLFSCCLYDKQLLQVKFILSYSLTFVLSAFILILCMSNWIQINPLNFLCPKWSIRNLGRKQYKIKFIAKRLVFFGYQGLEIEEKAFLSCCHQSWKLPNKARILKIAQALISENPNP